MISVRFASASAAKLRGEAQKLGRSLEMIDSSSGTKTAVRDGFIIKASKVDDLVTVRVLDTPAFLALPGRALVGGPGSNYTPTHCPLVAFPAGRDAVLYGTGADVADLYPDHPGCPPLPIVLGGSIAPAVSVIESASQPALSTYPGVGAVELTTPLYMPGSFVVNPYAFVSRTDSNMVYTLTLYSPQVARGQYALGAGEWDLTGGEVPASAPWSFALSDSVLWSFSGVLPFCKRVSPPAYDPGSTAATLFNSAQLPWARAIHLGRGQTTGGVPYYDTLLAVHVVTDMRNDDDRFGAKGLWFARLRAIANPSELGGPTLTLDWFALDDTRAGADPIMVPVLDAMADVYSTNNLFPAMLARLDDGTALAVVLHTNWYDPGTGFAPFNACYTYRWQADSLTRERFVPPVESITSPTDGKRHDFSFPIGIDSDGAVAHAVFFSSDVDYTGGVRTTETSIDVVRITASSSTVVLSQLIPQRYCRNITNSRFSCVRFIGNGKYMFPATDQNTVVGSQISTHGDLVAMIYDSATNQVSVAGVVLPTIEQRNLLYIGSLDCVAQERAEDNAVVRGAVVILTFGGLGQSVDDGGVEAGETYISRDSGATWQKVADFGSPAGARYCGTALQIRA